MNYGETVLNFTNLNEQKKVFPVTVYSDDGAVIANGTMTVGGYAVGVLNFAQADSGTWNRFGWIEIGTDDKKLILSGHRINETGSFTPLYSYDNYMGLDDVVDTLNRGH